LDAASGREHSRIRTENYLFGQAVAFAPDSKIFATTSYEGGAIHLWNVADGKEVKKMGPTPDDLYGIAFSRDGKELATSGYGGHLTLWNLAEGKALSDRPADTAAPGGIRWPASAISRWHGQALVPLCSGVRACVR